MDSKSLLFGLIGTREEELAPPLLGFEMLYLRAQPIALSLKPTLNEPTWQILLARARYLDAGGWDEDGQTDD